MDAGYCAECGARLSASGGACRECGQSRPSLGVRPWVGVALLLVIGAVGTWYLGPGVFGRAIRAREAVSDLALPATTRVSTREHGELSRIELERFVRIQERFRQENGRFQSYAEAQAEVGEFTMRYNDQTDGSSWFADLRHPGHREIWCAVAVGRVPIYVEGIVLRQSGQVRCSRDLATRINNVLRMVLPIRFTL
jgi:hypothetical protein